MPIEKLGYIIQRGTVTPSNPNGSYTTYMPGTDVTLANHDKINELVDMVNQMQSKSGNGGLGTDANVLLEIIKENNKTWMELLKFMKDMKIEVPK